ncbi:hypothetical protein JM82_0195 [Olleya sp. Hel_I_94]|nr:hypothetical protein JM82_0195 [Olleya sp. Hel_I_94]
MPISRLYQAFMLDIIIFTHLQRQYSVIEDKNKKVAGDFATFLTFRTSEQNTYCQHRIKLIAGFSFFTKVLADFKSVFYLLTLVHKTRN